MKYRLSLVMTNLLVASTMTLFSLWVVLYQNVYAFLDTSDFSSIWILFQFFGLVALILLYVFNVWVSIVHRSLLKSAGFQTSRLPYCFSSLLTFHTLSQLRL